MSEMKTETTVHGMMAEFKSVDSLLIACRRIRDAGYTKIDASLQYNVLRVNGKLTVYCPQLREPGEYSIAVVDRIIKGLAEQMPKM